MRVRGEEMERAATQGRPYAIAPMVAAVVCVLATCAWGEESSVIRYDWRGLDFSRGPERVADGALVANSTNFVVNSYDGSLRKAPGFVLDKKLSATGPVNGFAGSEWFVAAPNARKVLALANDDEWFARDNDAGTWTAVTEPVPLRASRWGRIQGAFYNGRLVIGGDSLSAFATYDGSALRRMKLPAEHDTSGMTASAASGGSLTASTWYHYAYTYSSPYATPAGSEEESWRSDTVMVKTTVSNKKVNLTNIRKFPYWFKGGADTLGATSKVNIYRGSPTTSLRWVASVPAGTIAWTDTGYTASLTRFAPDRRTEMTAGSWPVAHDDYLKYRGWAQDRPTRFVIAASWGITADTTDDFFRVTPDADRSLIVKVAERTVPVTAFRNVGNGTFVVERSSGLFATRNVVPGDYFSAKFGAETVYEVSFPHYFGQVIAVFGDDSVLVRATCPANTIYTDALTPGADTAKTVNYTIGDNVIRIGDEYLAICSDSTTITGSGAFPFWLVHRKVLGSTVAAHAAGSQIFVRGPDDPSQAIFYAAAGDPLRTLNYGTPYTIEPGVGGRVTWIGPMSGGLGIAKEGSWHLLSGSKPPFIRHPLTRQVGCPAPASIAGDEGGHLFLGNDGRVWGISDNGLAGPYSRPLGTAIRDSADATWWTDAAGIVFDGKYWLSVPRSSSTWACDVWLHPLDEEDVWYRMDGDSLKPRCWGVWKDAAGEDQLWFGAWNSAKVYRMDRDLTSANGAAITARAVTRRFRAPSGFALWEKVVFRIDNSDTVRIRATFDVGDSVFTKTYVNRATSATYTSGLSPTNGDTSPAAGRYRAWEWVINERAESVQLEFWTTGTGRCAIGDGEVQYRPARRW